MREILGTTDEPRTRRRWFHDDFFDLFVWQTDDGEITLMQLCYGVDSSERALVWHKHGGFFLDGVEAGAADSGQAIGAKLSPGRSLRDDPVAARFEAAAGMLPEDIRHGVIERIREYAEMKLAVPARRRRFRRASWQSTSRA